jgi:hypothetical protein
LNAEKAIVNSHKPHLPARSTAPIKVKYEKPIDHAYEQTLKAYESYLPRVLEDVEEDINNLRSVKEDWEDTYKQFKSIRMREMVDGLYEDPEILQLIHEGKQDNLDDFILEAKEEGDMRKVEKLTALKKQRDIEFRNRLAVFVAKKDK